MTQKPIKPVRSSLMITLICAASILLVGLILIKIKNSYVEYKKQKANIDSENERKSFEENNVVGELFLLSSDYPAPSEFVSIFHNSLLLNLKYKSFEIISTNTSAYPESEDYRISMSGSDIKDNVSTINRRSSSQVEKELAREALNATQQKYAYNSSTNYFSSISITNYTARKNSDSFFILSTNITIQEIDFTDKLPSLKSNDTIVNFSNQIKSNPNARLVIEYRPTTGKGAKRMTDLSINEIVNDLIVSNNKKNARFYSTNAIIAYKVLNKMPTISSDAAGRPSIGAATPGTVLIQLTIFISGGMESVTLNAFSNSDLVLIEQSKHESYSHQKNFSLRLFSPFDYNATPDGKSFSSKRRYNYYWDVELNVKSPTEKLLALNNLELCEICETNLFNHKESQYTKDIKPFIVEALNKKLNIINDSVYVDFVNYNQGEGFDSYTIELYKNLKINLKLQSIRDTNSISSLDRIDKDRLSKILFPKSTNINEIKTMKEAYNFIKSSVYGILGIDAVRSVDFFGQYKYE
jgi:hypothetical protein